MDYNIEVFIEEIKKRPNVFDSSRYDYRDTVKKLNSWEEIRELSSMESVDACQKLWKSLRDRFSRELKEIDRRARNGAPSYDLVSRWPLFQPLSFYKDYIKPRKSPFNYIHWDESLAVHENLSVMINEESDESSVQLTEEEPNSRIKNEPLEVVNGESNEYSTLVGGDSHYLKPSSSRTSFIGEPISKSSQTAIGEKRKKRKEDTIDVALLGQHMNKSDEAEHFALSLMHSMRRLDPQKMARAKLEITKILYAIEFENEKK